MKTIEEWFISVDDDRLRDRLLNNMLKHPCTRFKITEKVGSLATAIHEGFHWASTSEGREFWENEYEKLLAREGRRPPFDSIKDAPTTIAETPRHKTKEDSGEIIYRCKGMKFKLDLNVSL